MGGTWSVGGTQILIRSQKRVGGYSTDEMHEVSWWPDHLQCIAENITGALGSPFVERAGGAGILCCPVSVALAACGSLINSGEKIQFLIWTRCRSRSHVENSGRFLKKLKILLPLDPATPFWVCHPPSGFIPQALKAGSRGGVCPRVPSSTLRKSQTHKQPECPSASERVSAMRSLHPVDCYAACSRKDALTPAATGMDLGNPKPREASQAPREKYCLIALPWGPPRGSIPRNRREDGAVGVGAQGRRFPFCTLSCVDACPALPYPHFKLVRMAHFVL